jgi:hypothetical protein
MINSSGQLGTLGSSARYKQDIRDMGMQSDKLQQLHPVTFRYTADPQGAKQYGLIAEEVAEVYPELVTKGADGQVESVQYHQLIPLLLNELQQQQRRNDQQQQELVALRAQNAQLQAAMVRLEGLAVWLERLEAGQATPLAQR